MGIILMGTLTRTGITDRIRTMATIMGLHSIGTAGIDITTATIVIIGTTTGNKPT
jgi:hypothetical protein